MAKKSKTVVDKEEVDNKVTNVQDNEVQTNPGTPEDYFPDEIIREKLSFQKMIPSANLEIGKEGFEFSVARFVSLFNFKEEVPLSDSMEKVIMPAHARLLVSTGLVSNLPTCVFITLNDKFNLAREKGVSILPGKITGKAEIFILLKNETQSPVEIKLGDVVAQGTLMHTPHEIFDVSVIDE